jgi:hypothetical protein
MDETAQRKTTILEENTINRKITKGRTLADLLPVWYDNQTEL